MTLCIRPFGWAKGLPHCPWGQDYNGYLEWTLPNVTAGQSETKAYTVSLGAAVPIGDIVHGFACEGTVKAACSYALHICLSTDVPEACLAGFLFGEGEPAVCAAAITICFGEDYICDQAGGASCSSAAFPVRASVDPNDLTGPPGSGIQRWIAPKQIPYILSFNNLPTATAPVTNAVITDVVDPSTLDLSTLAVTGVAFGNTSYTLSNFPLADRPFSQDIDLRPGQDLIVRVTGALDPTTNQITVSFLSLDPATGLTPVDPLDGFLAPGVGGSVFFAVNPKHGLSTGTIIKNTGAVVRSSPCAFARLILADTQAIVITIRPAHRRKLLSELCRLFKVRPPSTELHFRASHFRAKALN